MATDNTVMNSINELVEMQDAEINCEMIEDSLWEYTSANLLQMCRCKNIKLNYAYGHQPDKNEIIRALINAEKDKVLPIYMGDGRSYSCSHTGKSCHYNTLNHVNIIIQPCHFKQTYRGIGMSSTSLSSSVDIPVQSPVTTDPGISTVTKVKSSADAPAITSKGTEPIDSQNSLTPIPATPATKVKPSSVAAPAITPTDTKSLTPTPDMKDTVPKVISSADAPAITSKGTEPIDSQNPLTSTPATTPTDTKSLAPDTKDTVTKVKSSADAPAITSKGTEPTDSQNSLTPTPTPNTKDTVTKVKSSSPAKPTTGEKTSVRKRRWSFEDNGATERVELTETECVKWDEIALDKKYRQRFDSKTRLWYSNGQGQGGLMAGVYHGKDGTKAKTKFVSCVKGSDDFKMILKDKRGTQSYYYVATKPEQYTITEPFPIPSEIQWTRAKQVFVDSYSSTLWNLGESVSDDVQHDNRKRVTRSSSGSTKRRQLCEPLPGQEQASQTGDHNIRNNICVMHMSTLHLCRVVSCRVHITSCTSLLSC